MSKYPNNIAEIKDEINSGSIKIGGGARFWAYISPQTDSVNYVTKWAVKIEQENGNWVGTITSDEPRKILETPNLSGIFLVTITASGPNLLEKQLSPLPDSKPDIGCNSNCGAMVGIVATEGGADANYWTVWDAHCN